MRTFLGIGAPHTLDVYDFAYKALSTYKPRSITLEQKMTFVGVGESTRLIRAREERFTAGECKIRYERETGDVISNGWYRKSTFTVANHGVRKVKLYLDDWCVLNGSSLEHNPALAYALDNDVPFYFVDIPLRGKSIVEFGCNGYRIIDLKDHAELTREIPADRLPFRSDNVTMNKFAADSINYLFNTGIDCVAHVGGTGHFNVQYLITDRWDPYPEYERTHIQDFVKADVTLIADCNTGILHELKSNPDAVQSGQNA